MAGQSTSDIASWMQHHGDSVIRTAYLLLHDRQLAEDVSQETFLHAWQRRGQLRDADKLRPWLTQIAANLCRQKMRRRSWRALVLRERIDESIADSRHGPEQVAMEGELIEQVLQLPYKYREVIVLFYYQSWSIDEISAWLHQSAGTVKSKLARARRLLRTKLLRDERDETGEEAKEHDRRKRTNR